MLTLDVRSRLKGIETPRGPSFTAMPSSPLNGLSRLKSGHLPNL